MYLTMSHLLSKDVSVRLASVCVLTLVGPAGVQAQSVNWDGQAGGIVTPYAYVVESPSDGITLPIVAFRLLNGGEVFGTHFQTSLTAGIANRFEFGYTCSSVASTSGGSGSASSLFDRGINTLHAKVNLVRENENGPPWPSISAGVVGRWQKQHLEGALGAATQHAEIYAVASRTFAVNDSLSVLANGGAKITKASLLGLAGNTPGWTPLGFVAGGLLVRRTVMVGGEFLQQPDEIEGISESELPATATLFVRVAPIAHHIGVDVSWIRLAGAIAPGLDAHAMNQFVWGGQLPVLKPSRNPTGGLRRNPWFSARRPRPPTSRVANRSSFKEWTGSPSRRSRYGGQPERSEGIWTRPGSNR